MQFDNHASIVLEGYQSEDDMLEQFILEVFLLRSLMLV